MTSPFTPIRNLLQKAPELGAKIEQILWVGGAIDAPGNLDPDALSHSPSRDSHGLPCISPRPRR